MASSRKNMDLYPELYDYYACFSRPRIVEYFSISENSELAENLSSLNYITAKPGVINLDINNEKKKHEENSYTKESKIEQSDLFFKFITNHKEIIQRYTGTIIEKAGFVFKQTTLTKIGNVLYDQYDTFVLSAHLLRGIIYVQVHDSKKIDYKKFDHKKFDPPHIAFDPEVFYEYCYSSKFADSKPNIHNPKKRFVVLSETNLNQHCILNPSELYGLDANDEQFKKKIPLNLERKLVIDELNKRDKVKLGFSTIYPPYLSINKSRRLWTTSFWCGTNKILCGFINGNGIVPEIKSYYIDDLENMGKGKWKEREILNFTAELLTFIKNCFKEKLKSEDITTANQRLYFCLTEYGSFEMTEQEGFGNSSWIPDWYINNGSIP